MNGRESKCLVKLATTAPQKGAAVVLQRERVEGGGQPTPEKEKETGKSHCVHGTHMDALGNRTVAELRPVKSVHEANPAKLL